MKMQVKKDHFDDEDSDGRPYFLSVRLSVDEKLKLKMLSESIDRPVSWIIWKAIAKMRPDWFTDYKL